MSKYAAKPPKSKLKPGMKVNVFQKPLTDEDHEGIATLVKFHDVCEGYGTERWDVIFDGDDVAYPREVNPKNVVK